MRPVGDVGADDWLERVGAINVWKRGDQRAPHKPLLILLALAAWRRTGSSRLSFEDAEPELAGLLQAFGPPGKSVSPQYPFVHLQSDGFWQLDTDVPVGSSFTLTQLRNGVAGQLSPEFEGALSEDPRLAPDVANLVLAGHFPESLHADICDAVGLDLDQLEVEMVKARVNRLVRRRDPQFRVRVLRAYSQRCAMCGFGGLLSGQAIGVEAAHIRWHAADGPDEVTNGLALCTVHHKLFDRGVLGASPDGEILVSANFAPMSEADDLYVTRLLGREIASPQSTSERPEADHVGWHQQQVFSGPVRASA